MFKTIVENSRSFCISFCVSDLPESIVLVALERVSLKPALWTGLNPDLSLAVNAGLNDKDSMNEWTNEWKKNKNYIQE